ncbi:hypothetical protein NVP2117O_11 [Vibrio phage 2.117.O._10N.261.45.E9]|nr:hypothetical protein NVP1117O_11 [Vibrio phage 1.117.O._10N.261.45.E9]AUR95412.1 hypothetical protein NVP1207B_05 [Vibrio phage 1.207.B._10N.222.51.C2]AUS02303.1 hypothetical protein NVP2117O_11 [Vibrio phage 2.117.O._10N.261.45.E9]
MPKKIKRLRTLLKNRKNHGKDTICYHLLTKWADMEGFEDWKAMVNDMTAEGWLAPMPSNDQIRFRITL